MQIKAIEIIDPLGHTPPTTLRPDQQDD